MRLLFLIDTSLSSGGIANYSRLIVSDLSRYEVESAIAGFAENRTKSAENEFIYHTQNAFTKRVPTMLYPFIASRELAKIRKSFRPDLVVAARQGSALWCLLTRTPFAYFVHQSESATIRYGEYSRIVKRLKSETTRFIDRLLFRKAHEVWIPSSALAVETFERGAPREHTRVVVPSIPVHDASEAPLERNTQGVLWAGRLTSLKDPFTAISLVSRMRQMGLPVTLKMAGRGPLESELREHIARTGISHYVSLVGYLDQAELHKEMNSNALFLISSHSESFSLVAVEALNAGMSLLSTRVGIVPDLANISDRIALFDSVDDIHFNTFSSLLTGERSDDVRSKLVKFSRHSISALVRDLSKTSSSPIRPDFELTGLSDD